MIRQLWGVARNDLTVWRHSPSAIAAALLPALGMGLLVALLTASVGQQPVALVVDGQGPQARDMAHLIEADSEAFLLTRMAHPDAEQALKNLKVAGMIVIPSDFDARVALAGARVDLFLNNVDIDFSDDIRRTVTRSVSEFDAPQLGILGELHGPSEGFMLPNPYRIAIAEHDRRATNVSFFQYQVIPVVILIVISVGMLGTALLTAHDFERRTIKLALLSPAHRSSLIAGRLLGGVLLTAAVLAPLGALVALTWVWHLPEVQGRIVGVDIGAITSVTQALQPPLAHWPAVLALLGAVTIMAVGLGVLIGVGLRRGRLVTMFGLNASAYLFFLGGGFTTVAFLPGWIEALSRLVPTSYAIAGLRQALFYPDLSGFAGDLLVLGGCAVAAAALGTLALARAWRPA